MKYLRKTKFRMVDNSAQYINMKLSETKTLLNATLDSVPANKIIGYKVFNLSITGKHLTSSLSIWLYEHLKLKVSPSLVVSSGFLPQHSTLFSIKPAALHIYTAFLSQLLHTKHPLKKLNLQLLSPRVPCARSFLSRLPNTV